MANKFSFLCLVATLSATPLSFAYNPNDPIGWNEDSSFPSSVTQNSGIYSSVFTFKNQMGFSVPFFNVLYSATPSSAFSIGSNECNTGSSILNGNTCQVHVNMDSSKLSAGTATFQANPTFAVFNILVPQPGVSIAVNQAPDVSPPTPPAPPAGSNYIMWSLPSTVISYPVYVYQGGSQVNYIPSSATQAFLGTYPAGVENKTFTLYYNVSGSTYASCNVVFTSSGTLDSSTTCSGAAINNPKASSSNVYTIALGATAFPGSSSPSSPAVPQYSNRGIVFKNDTQYAAIRVQGSCSDLTVCKGSATFYTEIIPHGTSTGITVGNNALTSAAFYVTAVCTAGTYSTSNCPSTVTGSNWTLTGGYNNDNGGHPYATKVESTFLEMTTSSTPSGASNVDVSAVDGFNIAVQLLPGDTTGTNATYTGANPPVPNTNSYPTVDTTTGAYCTYTVPPEDSNVLGAELYTSSAPLAKIFLSTASITNVKTLCTSSSQLPSGNGGTAWAMSVGDFTGCMSPCTYAKKNDPTDADKFCCTGSSYNTPGSCNAVSGTTIAANTSTYVSNVYANFKNVYPFAYGDAGSDYACEADKSYVFDFISTSGLNP